MELIGLVVVGAVVGGILTHLRYKEILSDWKIQATYLKNYISELEENAKQAKRKSAYKSGRRPSKKGGASRSTQRSSKAESGGSKSSK